MSKIGYLLFASTIFLTSIGIFILYESSSYTSLLQIGDKYHFIKNQLIWVALGIIASLFVARIPYKRLYTLALPLLLGSIALLVLVFVPGLGLELKGAHRWIDFHFFIVQPSELLKISLSIYLAAWLSSKEKGRLIAFSMLFMFCILLVALQPDMGTAFIIASTSITLYFLSGAKLKEMAFILLFLSLVSFVFIKIAPYRAARFTSFSNFDMNNINTASYHVKQVLIALGSGGWAGVGIGKSIQKYAYLPENTTDSIFAIYAEETGFIGSFLLLCLILSQLFLGFLIGIKAKDPFARLLACGITTFLAIQAFLNLGSQAVLIPLTGVPLPFISYGGSSMLINYIAIGILLSIARSLSHNKSK